MFTLFKGSNGLKYQIQKASNIINTINSNKNTIPRNHYLLSNIAHGSSNTRMRSFDRGGGDRDRRGGGRGGGGSRSRGGGGGRSYQQPADPFAQLSFRKTIKVDPEFKTPIKDMTFSEKTMKVLEEKKFDTLTPIQSQAFDAVFSGVDVVARSRTGTGKTFAFGLPIIEKLVAQGLDKATVRDGMPLVLILEPTRELAVQVSQELSSICKKHGMKVDAFYGGVSFYKQQEVIERGVHIVVSTPGRMLDHISRGTINLAHVRHVVLDEGDTMLEMGFQQAVESILMNVKSPGGKSRKLAAKALTDDFDNNDSDEDSDNDDDEDGLDTVDKSRVKAEVQMLLFSATMPAWICKITDRLMKNPIFLDAVQEGETRLSNTITHYAIQLPNLRDRRAAVKSYMEDLIVTKGNGGQTIVFTNTKEEADDLMNSDCFGLLRSQVLHGDIAQQTRQNTIRAFKEGRIDVLVATDVAARGLDIAGVDLVVHTDLPNDPDSFVHRSGRTGRAGREGVSIVFYDRSDERKLSLFQRALNFSFNKTGPPSAQEIVRATSANSLKKLSAVESEVVAMFEPYARELIHKALHDELALAKEKAGDSEDSDSEDADSDDESDREDGDGVVKAAEGGSVDGQFSEEVTQAKLHSIIARCLAVISNKNSISTRSLLTGESYQVTLQVEAVYRTGENPQTVPEYQKALLGVLRKLLDREDIRIGKMVLGRGARRDQMVLLADLDEAVADEALKAWKKVQGRMNGFVLDRCSVLPELIVDRDSGRFGGDRSRSGGRDSFSRDRDSRSRGGYDRDNRDRRDSRDSRGGDSRGSSRDSRDGGSSSGQVWRKQGQSSSPYGGRR